MTPQDHAAHAMGVSGTFGGHVLPGTLFLVWATWWLVDLWRRRGEPTIGLRPLESDLLVPLGKVVLTLAGIAVEFPGSDWERADIVTNLQHATMYGFFGLSGVVDLLHRGGRLAAGATYAAFAAAAVNAGFLFGAHADAGGVPAAVHGLLAWTFLAAAAAAMGEWVRPDLGLRWFRTGAVMVLGSWFLHIAWMLYRSEYDLFDPVNVMRTHLHFSWHVLVVSGALIAFRLVVGPPTVGGPGRGDRSEAPGVGAEEA